MNIEKIQNICHRLAVRYKSPNDYDDLVSEGTLEILEAMDKNSEIQEEECWGLARRRMHDYINLSKKAVHIPPTGISRTVAREVAGERSVASGTSLRESTLKALTVALVNHTEDVYDIEVSTPDHAILYEKKEYEQYMLDRVLEALDFRDLMILKLRYWDDMTLEEAAEAMGKNKSTLDRWEQRMLKKLSTLLENDY